MTRTPGRYFSPDPIALEGGLNLYAYVDNDPVNWMDEEGCCRNEEKQSISAQID